MSNILGSVPHDFAVGELHRRFNENCGPFTWLGYWVEVPGAFESLKGNQDLTLIGSTVNMFNGESSLLFATKRGHGMIFICHASSHTPQDVPEEAVMVAITARSFGEMNELVLLNDPRFKAIESWLGYQEYL